MFQWILNTLHSGLFRNLLVAIGVGVAVASVLTARSIARKKQSATGLQEYEWLHGRWKKSPLSKRD